VAQTVLDLLDAGTDVHLVADAVGSRSEGDAALALRRAERAGATLTSVEAVLFELLGGSDAPEFKAVQELVK
jgi:nicotinamidase-related amidase